MSAKPIGALAVAAALAGCHAEAAPVRGTSPIDVACVKKDGSLRTVVGIHQFMVQGDVVVFFLFDGAQEAVPLKEFTSCLVQTQVYGETPTR